MLAFFWEETHKMKTIMLEVKRFIRSVFIVICLLAGAVFLIMALMTPFYVYAGHNVDEPAYVIIKIKEDRPSPCPSSSKIVMGKHIDGSYFYDSATVNACYSTYSWFEAWSKRPEDGGSFLYRVDGPQK